MTTWKFALAIAMGVVGGCGNSPRHVEAPELPEPETIEESEAEATEPLPVDSDMTESSETSEAPDAEETEPGASESTEAKAEPEKAEPAKKGCMGLPKKTCVITAGCAWSTTDNCVQE